MKGVYPGWGNLWAGSGLTPGIIVVGIYAGAGGQAGIGTEG